MIPSSSLSALILMQMLSSDIFGSWLFRALCIKASKVLISYLSHGYEMDAQYTDVLNNKKEQCYLWLRFITL